MKNRLYNIFVDGLGKSVQYIGIITVIQVVLCIMCKTLNVELFTMMSMEELITCTKNITVFWGSLVIVMAVTLLGEWYYTW